MTTPQFDDIVYEVDGPAAIVTLNRPHRYNAFRGQTIEELIAAFRAAWADKSVRAVILTGAGDKAFCTGGDVKQRAETGDYGPTASGLFEIDAFHKLIRDIPKPVIAAVNGLAIGGGHVFHVLCDLTIASETARFGQVGPRVGSFDAGFGTTYLARVIGEKRAREMWFLCRQYDAATAERWGLVNVVVPEVVTSPPKAIFNVPPEPKARLVTVSVYVCRFQVPPSVTAVPLGNALFTPDTSVPLLILVAPP